MRKKIAIFTNGWSGEFLQEVGQGIMSGASIAGADLFVFTNYSVNSDTPSNQEAEFSIFKLPRLDDFDGAIIMANTFNCKHEFEYIEKELERTKIPAISLEYKLKGADYFGIDDYSGMSSLVEHLVEKHDVKNVVFIGGMREHQGSKIRLKALKDVLKRYNIELPEENIMYASFAAEPAIRHIATWIDSHNRLPDAVVCANDIMAIGVCNYLKKQNIDVPADVIVTGFDCLKAGQMNAPTLTTVNREWYGMGVRCIEKLINKIAGKEIVEAEEISTHLVCGESCGCEAYHHRNSSNLLRKTDTNQILDGFSCDQHFRHMFNVMRKSNSLQELSDNLSSFFIREGWLEGKDVMLALNPKFFYSETWNGLKTNGYPEEMDIVCNVINQVQEPAVKMRTRDIVFNVSSVKDEAGVYFFVPIRVDDVCPAFGMLSSDFSLFQRDVLYLWCRHMSQYTEQVKSNAIINQLNKRLEALSVTDYLTGIYNRTGCETAIYPAIEQNQLTGGQSVVMLVDLDRLKYINDTFGHGDGDIAIQTAIKVLKDTLPEGYMLGRYGGDEILVAGIVSETVDIDRIIDKALSNAVSESRLKKLPYTVSISIGAIQLNPGEAFDIKECIKRVDEKMYMMKDIHHQEMTTQKV